MGHAVAWAGIGRACYDGIIDWVEGQFRKNQPLVPGLIVHNHD